MQRALLLHLGYSLEQHLVEKLILFCWRGFRIDMNIRKFLNKRKKTTGTDEVVDQTSKQQRLLLAEKDSQNPAPSSQGDCIAPSISDNTPHNANEILENENDIGLYLNKNKLSKLSQTDKHNILTKPLKPHKNYNFKADVAEKQRPFVYSWMEDGEILPVVGLLRV